MGMQSRDVPRAEHAREKRGCQQGAMVDKLAWQQDNVMEGHLSWRQVEVVLGNGAQFGENP